MSFSRPRPHAPPLTRPKKFFGQHFLVDPRVQEKIVQAFELRPGGTVVEIGPGRGALTGWLVDQDIRLFAIETDRELFAWLKKKYQAKTTASFIQADVLRYDLSSLPDDLVVVGNLPYNISTPILERMIGFRHKIRAAYFTVQLEFGERLAAHENSKQYGALSCFIQYFADVDLLFKIQRGSFRPVPKVMSCLVKIVFRPPRYPALNEEKCSQLIRRAFQQRRKKILNALADYGDRNFLESVLTKVRIPLTARPENISLKQFVDLSNALIEKDKMTRGEIK